MNNEREEWRPVYEWEAAYEVSDLGRVRLVRAQSKIRKLAVSWFGYQIITLRSSDRVTTRTVHRLVLEAFVGPRPEGMECLHRNGVKTDNRLSNLHWDSRSENAFDRVRHGTHFSARKRFCPRGHEYTPENTQIGTRANGGKFRRCRACRRKAAPQ